MGSPGTHRAWESDHLIVSRQWQHSSNTDASLVKKRDYPKVQKRKYLRIAMNFTVNQVQTWLWVSEKEI